MKASAPLQIPTPVRWTAIALLASASIVGCGQNDPPSAAGTSPAAQQAPAAEAQAAGQVPAAAPLANTQKDSAMNDMATFVPAGSTLLDSKRGDLRGDGVAGALLVIDPVGTGKEMLGEGSPRTVVLLTAEGSTGLRKAAANAKIVPCARCGGLAGDPYAYARIDKGRFTISTSGGSRERWADDFTFRYASEQGTWVLDKVVRQVTDTMTDQGKTLDLGQKEFGVVSFEDFDPATLPKVGAPSGEGAG